jgi:hypothetical protein
LPINQKNKSNKAKRAKRIRQAKSLIARYALHTVLALQAAVLLTFFIDPSTPPNSQGLGQLLWALAHKPSFYPVAALLLIGIPVTVLTALYRGKHRIQIAISWISFLTLIALYHHHKFATMIQILYQQKDNV